MANDPDQNKLRFVVDIVNDPIVLRANAPTFATAQFFAADRAWIVFETDNTFKYALPIMLGNIVERFAGAPFDLNLVAQAFFGLG